MKAQQSKPVPAAVAEAIVNNAIKQHGKDVPAAATAKRASNRDKASGKGVTKDYSSLGHADAKVIWDAEEQAGKTQCEVLLHLAQFAPLGWGESTGKKRNFADATESYFNGWAKYRADLPKAKQASFGTRMSEARRVMAAYITKGVDFMNDLLKGPGTYGQKVNSLPTITGREPQPGGRTKKTGSTPQVPATVPGTTNVPTTGTQAGEQQPQRISAAAQYTDAEYAAIVGAATEPQLRALCHAIVVRLMASGDATNRDRGAKFKAILESGDRADAGPSFGIITDAAASKAANG